MKSNRGRYQKKVTGLVVEGYRTRKSKTLYQANRFGTMFLVIAYLKKLDPMS